MEESGTVQIPPRAASGVNGESETVQTPPHTAAGVHRESGIPPHTVNVQSSVATVCVSDSPVKPDQNIWNE